MRFVLFALMLAGCEDAPVIDDLQMPQQAVLSTEGDYLVQGLLSFHHDRVVEKLRIGLPQSGQTYEFPAQGGLQRGTLPLMVRFSSRSPRGRTAYEVSIVDVTGATSEAWRAVVTLP